MEQFLEKPIEGKISAVLNSREDKASLLLLHLKVAELTEMLERVPKTKSKLLAMIRDVLNAKGHYI